MRLAAMLVASMLGLVAWPPSGRAAEVTRVIDAFDGDKPFDGIFGLRFVHTRTTALVLREYINRTPAGSIPAFEVVDTRQLYSDESMNVLNLDFRAGLYHDLELYLTLPIVVGWTSSLEYDDGVGPGNSLVQSREYGINLLTVPYESATRVGVGDLVLGVKVAPFHSDRDPLYPSWVLGVEYSAPTGSVRTAGDSGVGSGIHGVSMYTAISRRVIPWWEPYFKLYGTLRFPAEGSPFQNERITQTLVSPGHSLGLLVGSELYPWNSPSDTEPFVSVDLGFTASFTFEGREQTELFDALGSSSCDPGNNCYRTRYTRNDPPGRKTDGVTDVEQYGRFGLEVGVAYQPLQHLRVRLGFAYWHTTSHFITFADAGKDLDGKNDVSSPNDDMLNEFNPFYNESYDDFGRRFRVDDKNSFQLVLSVEGQI